MTEILPKRSTPYKGCISCFAILAPATVQCPHCGEVLLRARSYEDRLTRKLTRAMSYELRPSVVRTLK